MPAKNQAKATTTNNVQILLGTNWAPSQPSAGMGDVLLRVWAEARPEPLSIIGGVISLSLFGAKVGCCAWTSTHAETIAVEARIKRVRAELRDLCTADTVILWGYLVGDAGYRVLQSIVIPELE